MIKAVIIDDELHCSETLKIELSMSCPDVDVIGVASSGDEGIELIQNLRPDLVFLDIEMPILNGFDVLKRIDVIDFDLIFVTAFDQYALKAFKYSAIDYLLKPVDTQELEDAIAKIRNRAQPKLGRDQIDFLLSVLSNRSERYKKIALPVSNRVEFIEVERIIRCEADSNYTKVFLNNGKELLLTKTLKTLEQMLSDHKFLRVHKSHLINPSHVSSFEKTEGGKIYMSDGTDIHVTKFSKKEFFQELHS